MLLIQLRHSISLKTRGPLFYLFILLMTGGIAFFLPMGLVFAQVSTNVPLDDFAYKDLDRLIAQGLIKSDLLGTRPITRMEMARLIHEARENFASLSQYERRRLYLIQDTLLLLENEFNEELQELTGSKGMVSTFIKPVERISFYYRYQDNDHSIFNSEGLNYYDGSNVVVDFTMQARIKSNLGLFAQPRFVYRENKEDLKNIKGNEIEGTITDFHKYYAKLAIRNLEMEYGKDSLWWGPSFHGALIMSNNAEPFKMFKLSNPAPIALPGLGLFKGNFIFTSLDSYRLNPIPSQEQFVTDHDNPYLLGLHLNFKPRPWFEFGINQINIYGGEGRENLGLDEHFNVFANHNLGGRLSVNSETSAFFLFRWYNFDNFVPLSETLSLYGELGGEGEGYTSDNIAFQLGFLFGDFLKYGGRLQFRMEYINTNPFDDDIEFAWYNHNEYPVTYDGMVFGHHVGSDAEDIFARLSILLNKKLEVGLQADLERHGTSLGTEERLLQGSIDAHYRFKENFSILGSVGIEQVENVDFNKGISEDRTLFSLLTRYSF